MSHHHHHHHRHHSSSHAVGGMPDSKKKVVGIVVALTLTIALTVLYYVSRNMELQRYTQMNSGFDASSDVARTIMYDGAEYRALSGITTILMIGTDKRAEREYIGARRGDQADFLQLVALDWKDHKIYRFEIDRDTISRVPVLGIMGNPAGNNDIQICLAQAFGATTADNCGNTVKAVEMLMNGVEIDHYVMVEMNSIAAVNHALEGVTVSVEEDLTSVDPAFFPGNTVCFTDQQARAFVQARMSVGDGTNEARMNRQRLYLDAAVDKFRNEICTDIDRLGDFMDQMNGILFSSMSDTVMADIIDRSKGFELMPVIVPKGEHAYGRNGFMEFHPDADALQRQILNVFYRPV